MPFLAQFDGKCHKCGGVIYGRLHRSEDEAHHITWERRSPAGAGPARKKVEHVNPTCDDVSRGIMSRSDIRGTLGGKSISIATVLAEAIPAPEQLQLVETEVAAVSPYPAPGSPRKLTTGHWWDVLKLLLKSECKRILLTGPPGTGKSTTAQLVEGERTYRITMTEGTGIEDLLGMYQLANDGAGTITKWVDGPATKALREGKRLQIDEITHTPSEIQSLLYALMDDDPQITLPTGEALYATAGYTCIGTTNDKPETLEPALMDRCEAILLACIPHPDSLKDVSAPCRAAVQNYYRGMDTSPWRFNRSCMVRPVRSFERIKRAGLLADELIAVAVFGDAAREFLSTITTAASKGVR